LRAGAETEVEGGSKTEAGNKGGAHEIKTSILRDVECGTMFHNSRFKYMIVYTIHEAIGPRMGGGRWWVGPVVFGWVVHDHNERDYTI